jgi:enediyne biosynthesis thioesterase
MRRGLALVTTHCSCNYISELNAFDEVVIRMRLGAVTQNRISMMFEYWRCDGEFERLVARGEQQVACMVRNEDSLVAAPLPTCLRDALLEYA